MPITLPPSEDPNAKIFYPPSKHKYISTRLIVHTGVTIAIALRRDGIGKLAFDYFVLDPQAAAQAETEGGTTLQALLDADGWSSEPKTLVFPTEIRVAGQEAVPTLAIPMVDRNGERSKSGNLGTSDQWSSTTLFLTANVPDFEVVSDGKHIYLFRQGIRADKAPLANPFIDKAGIGRTVVGNLLCDRFLFIGGTLSSALEVRFRRSGQKSLPLNNNDTLGVQDINDNYFREATLSLTFVPNIIQGRFSVIRLPTAGNDVFRWTFFVATPLRNASEIHVYSADSSDAGLFDLHGQCLYTCESEEHEAVYSSIPGPCKAIEDKSKKQCREAKVPVASMPSRSERCLTLGIKEADAVLTLKQPLSLSTGCALEAWICPITPPPPTGKGGVLQFPTGTFFTIFSLDAGLCVLLDNKNKLALAKVDTCGTYESLCTSEIALNGDEWNHIAIMIDPALDLAVMVNGTLTTKPGKLQLGKLTHIGSLAGSATSRFVGRIDEVRVWNAPVDPSVIMANRFKRTTGLEPLLAAVWHFDEGEGNVVFDSSGKENDIVISIDKTDSASQGSVADIWGPSDAPLVSQTGLARFTIRLEPGVQVTGGVSACVYYEQTVPPKLSTGNTPDKAPPVDKPLKRDARLLLCAIVTKKGVQGNRPMTLDFGILANGQLSDTPGTVRVPSLLPVKQAGITRVPTSMLYVDPQGTELYGGLILSDNSECSTDAPSVWDSAAGTIMLYLRGSNGTFGSIRYDITKSITVKEIASGQSTGLLIASKSRNASTVHIASKDHHWAPAKISITLALTAKLDSGEQVEVWRACDILNGMRSEEPKQIGALQALNVKMSDAKDVPLAYQLVFARPVAVALFAASCIRIGSTFFQVIRASAVGDRAIFVSRPYMLEGKWFDPTSPSDTPTQDQPADAGHHTALDTMNFPKGTAVFALDYDYTNLAGGMKSSNLVSIAPSPPDPSKAGGATLGVGIDFTIKREQAATPSFLSSEVSSALKFDGTSVSSLLDSSLAITPACSGLTFEAWIKVINHRPSMVLVGYTSEKASRNPEGDAEQQSFILASLYEPHLPPDFYLQGIINERAFRVKSSLFNRDKWIHFACSYRNLVAVKLGGKGYIDLGTASEFDVNDFSLMMSVQVDVLGAVTFLTKAKGILASDMYTPVKVVLSDNRFRLEFWADENQPNGEPLAKKYELHMPASTTIKAGVPYKLFVSRKMVNIPSRTLAPRQGQLVTMKLWTADGTYIGGIIPPTIESLAEVANDAKTPVQLFTAAGTFVCGSVRSTESPLVLGGASFATDHLRGKIGAFRLWSSCIGTPPNDLRQWQAPRKNAIGVWSCTTADGRYLKDDLGRNDGKFCSNIDEVSWTASPFTHDATLDIYVNGRSTTYDAVSDDRLSPLAGPHQLSLGNAVLTSGSKGEMRFLAMQDNFVGELDEMRIWEIPRTRENICDVIASRLAEVPPEMAVYYPFDVAGSTIQDETPNGWNLKPLRGKIEYTVSAAPISNDAPCVTSIFSTTADKTVIAARPAVAEYGDMTTSASGALEGSFKRGYAYIDPEGRLILITGHKIGTLITEWISQVQTAPTLIGHIEGAPPIPVENYTSRSDRPNSAVKWVNAKRVGYSYSARRELGNDRSMNTSRGIGAKWQASAGMGVETEVSSGEIKGQFKANIDISDSDIKNEVKTTTTHTNMDVRVELSGSWRATDGEEEYFEPNNTGIALVESEVADVFALRLKTRGDIQPLIAYQMRPNPDIPKDRNLVTFAINPRYTKQGCLDGKRGLERDPDYGVATSTSSYFKPAEAYALKDKIRRATEQLASEHERYTLAHKGAKARDLDKKLPTRTKRNICNTYVWTADGGTFQEINTEVDFVQHEVGGNTSNRSAIGFGFDMEVSLGGFLQTANIDAMFTTHFNLMLTKETNSENSFELQTELPSPIDIRHPDAKGKMVKKPGTVDAYRWMSFWLEPSAEATNVFFNQVIDPIWLQDPSDPDATVLRSLADSLKKEKSDARTKAWRVFHRCTYIHRVPEPLSVLPRPPPAAAAATNTDPKPTVLFESGPNWLLVQAFEPYVRKCKNKVEVYNVMREQAKESFPTLLAQPKLWAMVVDAMIEYVGVRS